MHDRSIAVRERCGHVIAQQVRCASDTRQLSIYMLIEATELVSAVSRPMRSTPVAAPAQ